MDSVKVFEADAALMGEVATAGGSNEASLLICQLYVYS